MGNGNIAITVSIDICCVTKINILDIGRFFSFFTQKLVFLLGFKYKHTIASAF